METAASLKTRGLEVTVVAPDQTPFEKALGGEMGGAFAWEIVVRAVILLGVPLFDLVRVLGTMVFGRTTPLLWWTTGMTLHLTVGAIWAIFYAYFFWSTFDWTPVAQGVVFSLLPALLAGLVMAPQMSLMRPLVLRGEMERIGVFALNLGWGGPAGVLLGHLIYGAVMGSFYTKPVGEPTGRGAVSHGRIHVRNWDRVQLPDH
jgi:hypothetical protein